MRLLQQAADTTTSAADTLAAEVAEAGSLRVDTVVVDTSSALTQLSRDVGEAGELIARGEWELVVRQLYEGIGLLIVGFIPKLIGAIFVFLLFYAAYRVLGSVLQRFLHRSKKVDIGLEKLVWKTYRVVASIFIGVMVLDQFGVNVTARVESYGIGTL